MRITVEVRDEDELRRVVAALGAEAIEVVVSGDGGAAMPGFEALLEATSGIWTAGDGLTYQQRLRDEWERPAS